MQVFLMYIFHLKGNKLTTNNIYKHSIQIKPGTPLICSEQNRLAYSQKEKVSTQLNNVIKYSIIELVRSGWFSPILLVLKKQFRLQKIKQLFN